MHALGASAAGRDLVADGRARTFIPLVPPSVARRRTVPLSVVLPLRERARRAADGSLNGPARWVNLTDPDGRLARLADFAASAGGAPVTWLLDPAVLDALEDFGRGNPPLSLGSERRRRRRRRRQPLRTAAPRPRRARLPSRGVPDEEQRARADAVLDTFLTTCASNTTLTLGYADPDVAALARSRPNLLRRADELSSRSMEVHSLGRLTGGGAAGRVLRPRPARPDPARTRWSCSATTRTSPSPPLSVLPTGQELVLTDERAVDRRPLAQPSTGAARAAPAHPRRGGPRGRPRARPRSVRSCSASRPAGTRGPTGPTSTFFGGLRVPVDPDGADPAGRDGALRRRPALRTRPARRGGRPRPTSRPPDAGAHQRRARATCSPTTTTSPTG